MHYDSECYCVKFSPNSQQYVLSGHQDRSIQLWNTNTQARICSFTGGHNREVFSISITQTDGSQFVSCGGDRQIVLWDTIKGQYTRKFGQNGNTGHTAERVNWVTNRFDIMASAGYDGQVCLWDLKDGKGHHRPVQSMREARDSVSVVHMTADSIVSGSIDGHIRVYDLRKAMVKEIEVHEPINGMDLSQDGKFAACSCTDSVTRVIDLESGLVLNSYEGAAGHTANTYKSAVMFSTDQKSIYQASEQKVVCQYDVESCSQKILPNCGQQVVVTLDVSHNPNSTNFSGSQNEEKLACSGSRGVITVINPKDPELS